MEQFGRAGIGQKQSSFGTPLCLGPKCVVRGFGHPFGILGKKMAGLIPKGFAFGRDKIEKNDGPSQKIVFGIGRNWMDSTEGLFAILVLSLFVVRIL